jgi:Na+-translocating ferredoxin:NAD+ oxidoreductase RnfD subunit
MQRRQNQQVSDMSFFTPISQAMNSLMLTKNYLYVVMNHQSCNHIRWLAMEVGCMLTKNYLYAHKKLSVSAQVSLLVTFFFFVFSCRHIDPFSQNHPLAP